jgi:hypothetical protein
LWYPPLVNIDSLNYIDQGGNSRSLTPGTDFQVDPVSEPAIIQPLPNQLWPLTMRGVKNAVQIQYTSGYETNAGLEPETLIVAHPTPPLQVASYTLGLTIPEPLVLALKMLVLHWYQNRDIIVITPGAGGVHQPLPQHIMDLIADYSAKDYSIRYYPREVQAGNNASEPVDLATAKLFCRITTTLDDDFVSGLIVAARRHLERATWRSLTKKKFLQVLDHFPSHFWPGQHMDLYSHSSY